MGPSLQPACGSPRRQAELVAPLLLLACGVGGEVVPATLRQPVIQPSHLAQTDTPSAIRSEPGGLSDFVAPSSDSASAFAFGAALGEAALTAFVE